MDRVICMNNRFVHDVNNKYHVSVTRKSFVFSTNISHAPIDQIIDFDRAKSQ